MRKMIILVIAALVIIGCATHGTTENPLEAKFADFNKDQISDFVSPLSESEDLVVYTGSLNVTDSFEVNIIEIKDINARDHRW
jgi:hypothetical protein